MLFDLEEDPSETPLVDSTLTEVPVQDDPSHLSLHAFRGSSSHATIYFRGFIEGKSVRVLLDGGNSDNFIQPRLAHLLRLPVQPSPRLRVMVGDGYCLQTEGYIPRLSVSINGHAITFPAYVLEVSGFEVVMGASWLATLGPHIADYSATQIKFTMGSDFVTLQGENSFVPQIAQYNHFRRLCSIDQIFEAYMLSCSSLELENTIMPCFPPNTPSDLLQVLYQYTSVFQVPTGLPSSRRHDHAIPLREGVSAISVKPYRYPFVQKSKIERMVAKCYSRALFSPATLLFPLKSYWSKSMMDLGGSALIIVP